MANTTVAETEDMRNLGHLASIFNENIDVNGRTFYPERYKSYVTKRLGAETLGRIREGLSDPDGRRMLYSFMYINGGSTAAYEKLKVIMGDKDPRARLRETLDLRAKGGTTAESLMKGNEKYNLGEAAYGLAFLGSAGETAPARMAKVREAVEEATKKEAVAPAPMKTETVAAPKAAKPEAIATPRVPAQVADKDVVKEAPIGKWTLTFMGDSKDKIASLDRVGLSGLKATTRDRQEFYLMAGRTMDGRDEIQIRSGTSTMAHLILENNRFAGLKGDEIPAAFSGMSIKDNEKTGIRYVVDMRSFASPPKTPAEAAREAERAKIARIRQEFEAKRAATLQVAQANPQKQANEPLMYWTSSLWQRQPLGGPRQVNVSIGFPKSWKESMLVDRTGDNELKFTNAKTNESVYFSIDKKGDINVRDGENKPLAIFRKRGKELVRQPGAEGWSGGLRVLDGNAKQTVAEYLPPRAQPEMQVATKAPERAAPPAVPAREVMGTASPIMYMETSLWQRRPLGKDKRVDIGIGLPESQARNINVDVVEDNRMKFTDKNTRESFYVSMDGSGRIIVENGNGSQMAAFKEKKGRLVLQDGSIDGSMLGGIKITKKDGSVAEYSKAAKGGQAKVAMKE